MSRFNVRTAMLGRWQSVGALLALTFSGTHARAAFTSWGAIPNGAHATTSGPALTVAQADYTASCTTWAANDELHIYAVKDDNQLWETIGSGAGFSWPEYAGPWTWSAWSQMDTFCPVPPQNNQTCNFSNSNPAATTFYLQNVDGTYWTNQIAVVARNATTNIAFANFWIGDPGDPECGDRSWLGWQPLPGTWIHDVAIVFWSHYLYVFGVGSNGAMRWTRTDANNVGAWDAVQQISTAIFTTGAAATVINNEIYVAARNNDPIYMPYYYTMSPDGQNWTGWIGMPGPGWQSAPALSGWYDYTSGDTRLDVSGMVYPSGGVAHGTSDNFGSWTWSAVNSASSSFPPASYSSDVDWGVTRMAITEGDGKVYECDGP